MLGHACFASEENLDSFSLCLFSWQGALGLELWSMSDDILFDNFLITDDPQVAEEYAAISWEIKSNEERAASSAGVLTKLPFGGEGVGGWFVLCRIRR